MRTLLYNLHVYPYIYTVGGVVAVVIVVTKNKSEEKTDA